MESGDINILGDLQLYNRVEAQALQGLYDNIMLNAFKDAIGESRTRFNLVDGIIDEFEDETGIDIPECIDIHYNSGGKYFNTFAGYDVSDRLFREFHLDDNASNLIVIDTSIYNQNASLVGGDNTSVKHATGKFDGAFTLNGTDDYIDLGNNLLTNANIVNGFTVTLWAKGTTGTSQNIIGFENLFAIDIENRKSGYIVAYSYNGNNVWSSGFAKTNFTDGNWHFLCIRLDSSGNLGLYMDGSWDTVVANARPLFDSYSRKWCIGSNGYSTPAQFFNGTIDEVKIFKGYLTNTEVDFLYNSGVGTILNSDDTADNITLISTAVNVDFIPQNGRIVLFEEDVDIITLNTDLKVYASLDDGATWAQAIIEDVCNYEALKKVLAGSIDFTETGLGVATGNPIKWKVTTHNNKGLKIHGIGLLWD